MAGDIIKVGRVFFRIKQMAVNGTLSKDNLTDCEDAKEVEVSKALHREANENVGELPCRICLRE